MSTAVENLKAARAWLGEGEHRWHQGWYGTDAVSGCDLDGTEFAETDPSEISSCCALGALSRIVGGNPEDGSLGIDVFLYRALEHEPKKPFTFDAVVQFNDNPNTTYPDILALYDRAIELAEQAEGGAS